MSDRLTLMAGAFIGAFIGVLVTLLVIGGCAVFLSTTSLDNEALKSTFETQVARKVRERQARKKGSGK